METDGRTGNGREPTDGEWIKMIAAEILANVGEMTTEFLKYAKTFDEQEVSGSVTAYVLTVLVASVLKLDETGNEWLIAIGVP